MKGIKPERRSLENTLIRVETAEHANMSDKWVSQEKGGTSEGEKALKWEYGHILSREKYQKPNIIVVDPIQHATLMEVRTPME